MSHSHSSPEKLRLNPLTQISVSDLQDLFSKDPPKEDSRISCQLVIVGIVILIVIVLSMSFKTCRRGLNDMMTFSATSGRKSDTKSVDYHAKINLSEFEVENLTHCSESDSKCKDFKNVDEKFKVETGEKLKEFDEKNNDVVYMIYAPWCPHCHTALPKFGEASTKSDVKFALVNAEMVPSSILQGKDALFNVTHFPFICHKNKEKNIVDVFKGAPAADTIARFAEKKENEPSPKKQDPLDFMFA
tara:strand:- start:3113 stop:3847 length:735 start_codon:yes stop_codon:yes gene_type:complete